MKNLTCKRWKVTVRKHDSWTFDGRKYTTKDKGQVLASCLVYAPNKRFARWNSEQTIGYTASYSLLYPDSVIVKHVSLEK